MSKSIYREWQDSGILDDVLKKVRDWRGEGAELDEIAKKLGIGRATLFDYQKRHPDFADALKIGREIMDSKVEDSLLKECVGYQYEETTTTTVAIINKKTGQVTDLEKVEKRTTKRWARPSPVAIAYYLNNRKPKEWKNKVVFDGDDDNGILPKLLEAMNELKDRRTAESEAT